MRRSRIVCCVLILSSCKERSPAVDAPIIDRVEGGLLEPGSRFQVVGDRFAQDSVVLIDDLEATAVEILSPQMIAAVVPEAIQIAACLEQRSLSVRNQYGDSAPVTIALQPPAPQLLGSPGSFVAGDPVVLEIVGARVASVRIRGASVPFAETAQGLTIDVPRELAPGEASLELDSSCRTSAHTISIAPPRPRISSIQPSLLRPGESILITMAEPVVSELSAVQVGNMTLMTSEPGRIKVAPEGVAAQEQLAVRIPDELGEGDFTVEIVSDRGRSDPVSISFTSQAEDGIVVPPTPAWLQFTPLVSDIVSFPIGTDGFTAYKRGPSNQWWYSGFRTCSYTGDITDGFEYYFENDPPADIREAVDRITRVPEVLPKHYPTFEHPMQLSFSVEGGLNRVSATIDRTASGGAVETYSGGFGPVDPCNGSSVVVPDYLSMTSETTGRQLLIRLGTSVCGLSDIFNPFAVSFSVGGAITEDVCVREVYASFTAPELRVYNLDGAVDLRITVAAVDAAFADAEAQLQIMLGGALYVAPAGACRASLDELQPYPRGRARCDEPLTSPGLPPAIIDDDIIFVIRPSF